MLANQAKVRFEHFLLFFIILQPVLDLLTSLSIVLLKVKCDCWNFGKISYYGSWWYLHFNSGKREGK